LSLIAGVATYKSIYGWDQAIEIISQPVIWKTQY
jgi:hypothetical protein